MKRLQNKVAIVTGAASGIGQAIATLFSKEGAKVIATDKQEEKLREWVEEFQKIDKSQISYLAQDVSQEESWKQVVDKTIQEYHKIDILVNNAGILPESESLENTTKEMWDKVIATNLTSLFLGCKAVIPNMKENGGSIINISSIAGMEGGTHVAYATSKGGVRILTKALAAEYGKYNIRINSIMPGVIATSMTEEMLKDKETRKECDNLASLGRIGKPEEVAYGALFLASEESSFMTGTDFVIDGGSISQFKIKIK